MLSECHKPFVVTSWELATTRAEQRFDGVRGLIEVLLAQHELCQSLFWHERLWINHLGLFIRGQRRVGLPHGIIEIAQGNVRAYILWRQLDGLVIRRFHL